MKCAMLVVSEVPTTILPSGLTAMPSGSTPTAHRAERPCVATSMKVRTIASFSLATYSVLPSGEMCEPFRVAAGGEARRSPRASCGSMICDRVVVAERDIDGLAVAG